MQEVKEEQPKNELPVKIEPIVVQIQSVLPKMVKGRDLAVKALSEVPEEIGTDDQREEAAELAAIGSNTSTDITNLRMPITKEFDSLKSQLMQFEKDVDASVARVRKVIASYDQKKLDRKREEEEKARKIKEKEDYKVLLEAHIRQTLSNLLITRAKEVTDGAAKFFSEMTLEKYEAQAAQFRSFSPKLKEDAYLKCFSVVCDHNKLPKQEFDELIAKVQKEEPYDTWNAKYTEVLTPILSDWKAKLPARKEELVALANAATEAEKKKLQEQQAEKDRIQKEQQQKQLQQVEREQQQENEQRKEVDLMNNTFQEQGINQQFEDVGPTKRIIRFKNDKVIAKPLCEIILHCLNHPKFPGIVKKDGKSKQVKLDDNGFPEYSDLVDGWIKFFAAHCKDKHVEGIEVKEVTKTIIRSK